MSTTMAGVSGTSLADKPGSVPPTRSQRIAGIDIARGLALLGMFNVHTIIDNPDGSTDLPRWLDWALDAPEGRSSVLFMLLAGVSLSLVRSRGAASSSDAAIRRRGLALLVGGLLLSSSIWSGSILEHYGTLFLFAPWLFAFRTRTLAGVALTSCVVGPIILLQAPRLRSAVPFEEGALRWLYETTTRVWLHGLYPLVVWFGIFCVGLLLGRLDLASTRNALRLLGVGLAGVALVAVVVGGLAVAGIEAVGDAGADGSDNIEEVADDERAKAPSELLSTEPHSGGIAWVAQSLAIAVTVLGGALVLPATLARIAQPLAMLGSVSLTAYLVHIVMLTDIFLAHVQDSALGTWPQYGILLALQVCLILMAVVIRSRWKRGPFEWLVAQMTAPPRS